MRSNKIKQDLREALPGAELSVRQKRGHTVVTFVDYFHTLVSLGVVIDALVSKKAKGLINLPWSAPNQISPLLSREGKRATKSVLSQIAAVVTVHPDVWYRHIILRHYELGVVPDYTDKLAISEWLRHIGRQRQLDAFCTRRWNYEAILKLNS